MKIRKYLSMFLILAMVLTTFAGCSGKTETAETAEATETAQASETEMDAEQTYNVVMVADPSTLDASKGADMYSNSILNNVLEPLTRLEEDENQKNFVAPAGAASWESNEEGTVWTFKLVENTWSDGQKVTAKDYEYGIKRTISPDTASPYAFLLAPIKNAEKVSSGELGVEELGVKAIDDTTLEITLEGPTPYFLQLTYHRVMLPQREDIVAKYGDEYGTQIDKLVYNGPFVLTSWVNNSEITMVKNENYWDKDKVKLQNINFKIIQEENAIFNSLANGSIDGAVVNIPEWKEKFMKDERLTFEEVVDPATYFVFFNTQDELFKNANIRRAFSSAINREELADVIFKGVMKPGYGWVSPSIAIGEDEYRGIVEEPVQTLKKENPDAKALLVKGLEELGMDTNPANLTVKISLGATSQWFKTYGEYLQQMYGKALGVNVEIEQNDWPVFNSAVEKGEYQMGYMAWGADFNDPLSMLSIFQSDAGAIANGWSNARYDELIKLASVEMDVAKRLEYYTEAEKILIYDEAVVAPVVYPRSNVFRYNYVKNVGVTPFGTQGFKYVYIQGKQ